MVPIGMGTQIHMLVPAHLDGEYHLELRQPAIMKLYHLCLPDVSRIHLMVRPCGALSRNGFNR